MIRLDLNNGRTCELRSEIEATMRYRGFDQFQREFRRPLHPMMNLGTNEKKKKKKKCKDDNGDPLPSPEVKQGTARATRSASVGTDIGSGAGSSRACHLLWMVKVKRW
jgi:hypothetical protein